MLRSAAALPQKKGKRTMQHPQLDQSRPPCGGPARAVLPLVQQISLENANGLRLFWA